jgi:hypothetical protein
MARPRNDVNTVFVRDLIIIFLFDLLPLPYTTVLVSEERNIFYLTNFQCLLQIQYIGLQVF